MTIREAKQICEEFDRKTNPTEEEVSLFTEAAMYLIGETKDPRIMMYLGGWYYEQKDFDSALKYYELAAELNYEPAFEGLGYIWYYGRTGTRDYGKAFYYYEKAANAGNPDCMYKIADMYKNGYYVEKDEAKYREIIENLYEARPTIEDMRYYPLPEIYTRLARIRMDEGRWETAEGLLLQAKDELANRITVNPFFGNLSIMKGLVKDLFEVRNMMIRGYDGIDGPIAAADVMGPDIDLYDLYILLNEPAKYRFFYGMFGGAQPVDRIDVETHTYEVEALEKDGALAVRFTGGSEEYRYGSIDEFFEKAEIGGERIVVLYYDLYGFVPCGE